MGFKSQAEYVAKILKLHNDYREKHGSQPLRWSVELQKDATDYATHMAAARISTNEGASTKLMPCGGVPWGQNFFEYANHSGMDVTSVVVEEAIRSWYDEIHEYKWSRPGTAGLSFSQLIWRGTMRVGVGVGTAKGSRDEEWIVVAGFYDPCGNYRGEFSTNVYKQSNSARHLLLDEDGKPKIFRTY